MVGVAVHYWAKRSRGSSDCRQQARELLEFLEPMFDEWEMDAVKGIGWGLKSLGKVCPDLVCDWLAVDIVPAQRKHRSLMLRKALTWLTAEQQQRVLQAGAHGTARMGSNLDRGEGHVGPVEDEQSVVES
jgi:hypothetical protein